MFLTFFVFFIDFHGFYCDLVILGSYFDILGILGIWEKMCSVGFSLVFEFLFCWGILLLGIWDTSAVQVVHLSLSFFFLESFAESCFFSFWGGTRKKTNNVRTVWWTEGVGFGISSIASSSLGDRKKGYPKRQALWELTLALCRFSFDFICFLTFFVFFCVLHRFSMIVL